MMDRNGLGLLAVLSLLLVVGSCYAADGSRPPADISLGPEQVLIVANGRVPASREIAEYYARKRGIPLERIVYLSLPEKELISRRLYDRDVVAELRKAIEERRLKDKVKVIVTVYGVPLKIGPFVPTGKRKRAADAVAGILKQDCTSIEEAIVRLAAIAKEPAKSTGQPAKIRTPYIRSSTYVSRLSKRLSAAVEAAHSRVAKVADGQLRGRWREQLERIRAEVGGLRYRAGRLAAGGEHDLAGEPTEQYRRIAAELAELRTRAEGFARLDRTDPRRLQLYQCIKRAGGLLAAVAVEFADFAVLQQLQSHAAFDSELSLLWWDDYPLARWVPNLLAGSQVKPAGSGQVARSGPFARSGPTLMVSRLDGPSPQTVRAMIDRALAAERQGLRGVVYLDARGYSDRRRGYGRYDGSIRRLAQWLRQNTSLKVVLDNRPALFAAGSCPDAALYCGWYALGNYHDAFDWATGAVGFHIASSEAASLHTPNNKQWCQAMIADGITATLGPTSEPYLAAFPLPEHFFKLLVSGRHTLVECFYLSKPFNSWQMVLIGDPLYNPFRNHSVLRQSGK